MSADAGPSADPPSNVGLDAQPRVEPAPHVVLAFGRRWPRALSFERFFWGAAGLAALVVLGLSVWLKPDARGIGTHEQLGLPPCGFVQMFEGMPCPSCGFTTTFALAAHARPLDAIHNQPFGFVLFLVTVAAVPIALGACVRGVSLFELTERWPWGRVFIAFLSLWLLAWLYKWLVLMR